MIRKKSPFIDQTTPLRLIRPKIKTTSNLANSQLPVKAKSTSYAQDGNILNG
jgi:hypothetical protein